jgi:alanine-alpha-ketoisovalerate/valine-pyruvate aminotransferase
VASYRSMSGGSKNVIETEVRRMASSWMLHCVALVRTDVSGELRVSIIRVTRISELGTLAITNVHSSAILVTLMMEMLSSSEMSVLSRATLRNIQKDAILHSPCCENLKSCKRKYVQKTVALTLPEGVPSWECISSSS